MRVRNGSYYERVVNMAVSSSSLKGSMLLMKNRQRTSKSPRGHEWRKREKVISFAVCVWSLFLREPTFLTMQRRVRF